MSEGKKEEPRQVPGAIYANQIVGSFGSGVAAPFVASYAKRLNATGVELGWLQSIQNLFPNVLQIPWSRLSDRLGRKTPFVIVGTALAALAYLMMIASSTAMLVILAALFQSVATSAVVPAWSALIGEKVPTATRGRTLGSIGRWAGISGVIGGIVAAFLVLPAPQESASAFQMPFVAATVAGLIAALAIVKLHETKTPPRTQSDGGVVVENEEQRRCNFRFFVQVQVFYNFFMSFIWPIMIITQIDVLHMSNTDVTILNLIGALATVAVQSQVGKLMDRVGPVSLISASRFMLVVVPLVYGFANNVYELYVMNVLLGAALAMANVAYSGYLLDVAPTHRRGEYFARFNAAVGVATFAGSLIAGYLATFLMGIWGIWLGLLFVYMLSFGGRLIGAVMTVKVKECRQYPEKMSDIMQGVRDNIPFFRPPE